MILISLISTVLALAGLLLLVRGIWPPREGTDPYCWECAYNLTGLNRETCPECGGSIAEHRIVFGQRRRRPGRILVGAVCVLPVLLLIVGLFAQVDFYQHLPAVWVMNDLHSSDTAVATKAWKELTRRMNVGSLSAGNMFDLVDTCLVEQARPGGTMTDPLLEEYGTFLTDAYLQQGMSQQQAETFFTQLVTFELKVRPQILLGEGLPYGVESRQGRVSLPSSWWYSGGDAQIFVDGQKYEEDRFKSSSELQSGCSSGSWTAAASPQPDGGGKGIDAGKHTLTVKLRYAVYSGGRLSTAQLGILHWDRTITLSGPFEVLEAGSEDYLKIVKDPGLADALRKCLQPTRLQHHDFYFNPQEKSIQGHLEITQPLPVDLAFDVFARVGETETKLTTVTSPRDRESNYLLYWEDADPQLTSVDIILRTNMEIARNAVDVFEVWEGELVYKDVPIAPKEPWPTSGSGAQTTQPQPTPTSAPTTAPTP